MATAIENAGEDCLVEVPIRLSLVEVDRLVRVVDRAKRSGMMDADGASVAATPERLAAFARFLLAARRRRDGVFPNVEFGEPAWDMLLDLYVQHVEGRQVCVSSLCTAAAVPATTALRWIDMMVREDIFVRQPDPADGRRVHVRLNGSVVDTLEAYLGDMRDRAWRAIQ
jgi:hypothetical protein